jgi:tetratricopeptide (TPR) repeat protein
MKSCIAHTVYNPWGKVDLAYQISSEGIQLAEESGDIISKAEAYSNHGIACWGKGFLDEAEACLLKGLDLGTRANYWGAIVNAIQYLGDIYCTRAEYQKAQEYYEKTISVVKRNGLLPSGISYFRVALARVKAMNKEKDVDLESLYVYSNENKIKYIEGPFSNRIAEILLNIDDRHMTEAEEWVKKAIEADTRNRTMLYLGMDYAFYAELLKRKGDLAGAREKLGKAMEIYRECGADGWLKKAGEDMEELQKPGKKRASSTGR